MTTAQTLRTHGQHQAEAAADMRVIALIDRAILDANASGREWSANDIRAQFPATRSKGLVGARIDLARRRKQMVGVGFVRSDLPSTRSAWIKRWVGAR